MKLQKRYTPPPGANARHLQGAEPQAVTPRTSARAKNEKLGKADAPTVPPPAMEKAERNRSGVRARKSQQPPPAATVDEVTADMSRDPRRED